MPLGSNEKGSIFFKRLLCLFFSFCGTNLSRFEASEGVQIQSNAVLESTGTKEIHITGSATGGSVACQCANFARILSTQTNVTIKSQNNPVRVTRAGGISLQGPANLKVNTPTELEITNDFGGPAFISLENGTGQFNVGRDVSLTAGANPGEDVQIGNPGLANTSAPLIFNVVGNVSVNAAAGNYAVIGHGSPLVAQTHTRRIDFQNAGGVVAVVGGATGFAQIGHINANAGGQL